MNIMDPNQPIPNIPTQPIQQPFTPPPPKPTSKLIFLIGGLVILLIGLSGGFLILKSSSTEKPKTNPIGKGCTQEAKLCPDGSSVGRTGPNCEFAQCPEIITIQPSPTPDPMANWKTYTNEKHRYAFQYVPDANLKLFGCSMRVSGEKGEETVVFDKFNSTFQECAFGGYAWPISISIESSPLQCNAGLGYTISRSEIKVASIAATKCIQKFTGFPDQNPEYIKGPDDIIDIFLAREGEYYRFTLTNLKYSQTFDQILSTFKFVESNVELSLTKLYEIKKPDAWKVISSDVDAASYVTKIGLESDTRKPIVTISTFKYEYTSGGHDAPGPLTNSRDIVISGVKTKLDKYTGKGIADQLPLSTLEVIRLLNDQGNYFVIEFSYLNRDELSDKQMDDQFINILSTFKFL